MICAVKQVLKEFLHACDLSASTTFFQCVTSQVLLDLLIKEKFPVSTESSSDISSSPSELTYEERNAIRYIGGYIIRKLRER